MDIRLALVDDEKMTEALPVSQSLLLHLGFRADLDFAHPEKTS